MTYKLLEKEVSTEDLVKLCDEANNEDEKNFLEFLSAAETKAPMVKAIQLFINMNAVSEGDNPFTCTTGRKATFHDLMLFFEEFEEFEAADEDKVIDESKN